MKPPIEPPQSHPSRSATGKKKPSEIEPPKEPFINLTDTGPVDPTKFQRFIVPMEFIQKAHELDLSQVREEDSDTLGSDEQPSTDCQPNSTAASRSTQNKPGDSGEQALPNVRFDGHPPVAPPAASIAHQTTTRVVIRRPVGIFARWQLSGKMPSALKLRLAAIVVLVCILILSYIHLKAGGPTRVNIETPAVSQSPVSSRGESVAKSHTEVESQPRATTSVGEAASAHTGDSPESLPLLGEPPAETKARSVKNRPRTAPKPNNEHPSRSNVNAVAPTPSASAIVKGVTPVIEPE